MPIALSCGLVLLNEDAEVLLAHATETRHWDIPKGAPEPGESYRDTALRETREETGLDLDGHALVELGRVPFRRDKELHLFATRLRRWATAEVVSQHASQSLARLFAQTLTLASIDARLREAGL